MRKVTIGPELKKEFGLLARALNEKATRFITAKPKLSYSAMLLLMCISGIYVFLFLKTGHEPVRRKGPNVTVLAHSGSSVQDIYAKLKLTLYLQSSIKVLLAKDSLSHADSLQLTALLEQIEKIQHDKIPK